MGRAKEPTPLVANGKYPKARTPEARDNQLIALSYDLVEARLRAGTATSQETTFFLKLAAQREEEKLKREIMEEQKKLMKAKTESLQSAKRIEELYADAMKAFQSYKSSADDHV
jgi:hypothetical protein